MRMKTGGTTIERCSLRDEITAVAKVLWHKEEHCKNEVRRVSMVCVVKLLSWMIHKCWMSWKKCHNLHKGLYLHQTVLAASLPIRLVMQAIPSLMRKIRK